VFAPALYQPDRADGGSLPYAPQPQHDYAWRTTVVQDKATNNESFGKHMRRSNV
jgi:hypothetical protein